MGRAFRKTINFILVLGLLVFVGKTGLEHVMVAGATTVQEIQQQMQAHQDQLNQIYSQISGMEDEQDLIEEQIADLNAEIVNAMASISMKEDEIQEKSEEIDRKSFQIDETEKEYNAAVERENDQRESMSAYTRMMYENNETSYLVSMLKGEGLSDILNKMDYIERVYEYSMEKLQNYMDTKDEVHDLWDRLEEEKAELEEHRSDLEADKAVLEGLKGDLDLKLTRKKQESANFDAEIKKARQEAAVAKKLLQQDKERLRKLQAAQNPPSTANTPANYAQVIDNATGSELGKKIAKYGCQFIGNPYVMGGTSLTNGADCSGFTYRIYQDFGYSIPRTSYEQRSAGKGVTYAEAQPGDLICYDGHVAMYIGGGLIVHASTAKTGIKVSNAQYRTILAVRRII